MIDVNRSTPSLSGTSTSVTKPKTPSTRTLVHTNIEDRAKELNSETESFIERAATLPQLQTQGDDKGPHKEYVINLSEEIHQVVEDTKNTVKRLIGHVNRNLREIGLFN